MPTPPSAPPSPSASELLDQLGSLLHGLYRSAQRCGVESFEAAVFEQLGSCLRFDAAWIGRSTLTPSGPVMHHSALFGLDSAYPTDWAAVRHLDPLVPSVTEHPGTAVALTVADPGLPDAFRGFLARHGIAQVLCCATVDPVLQTCLHVSLYRSTLQPPFSPMQQQLLAPALPNLAAALSLNRMAEMQRVGADSSQRRVGVALVTGQGVIECADPLFGEHLLAEWPAWPGGVIPAALRRSPAQAPKPRYIGQHLVIDSEARGALWVLRAQRLTASSSLTPRERAVALAFAQGNSYKAVARDLGMAPATVRHHLRKVYAKLGIQDKGAIAWVLSQDARGPDAEPAPATQA